MCIFSPKPTQLHAASHQPHSFDMLGKVVKLLAGMETADLNKQF